ncbi:ribosome silencing factor [Granulosicoccus antarcticus]|uniref:Ribosomal silencing factor RsfS n=1 Tax=Granulosicoccus antarcticus IMCC3135 TaxID=1192854 RepID=A0A2Z2P1M9_9GAMM|nr:ribosome silencing factor [Granulosicoccus antarcticus]ASJ76128.1 Ribosomal silencing factor RsfS [Granulosicoccus antarcticus IMCC3135]
MNSQAVIDMSVQVLEDMKGIDLTVIDIVGKSSIADAMIVVTGTSQRHVRSMAETVRLAAKEANHPPLGVEGGDSSDWVLVDLGDVIVHVMTEEKRDFYSLEKLWSVGPDTQQHAADDEDTDSSNVAGSH